MEAHIHNAHALGMRYVRFTDHDTRTGTLPGRVHHFDFTFPEKQKATWMPEGDVTVTRGDGGLTVSTVSTGEAVEGRAILQAPGKKQSVSLLAEVTLTLELTAAIVGEAGFAVDIELSQRPGDYKPAHLCYVQGQPPAHLPPHTVCVPLPASEDGTYRLAVSADAEKYGEEIGGPDNAYNFPGIRVWADKGGQVTCRLTCYDMQVQYAFEDVLRRQRAVADEIGRRYGIKPYITTEISGAGQHKNYYGEQVPCIDYAAHNFEVSQEEAIAHVQAHGGIFCYNHPFENGYYKQNKFTAEERPAQVALLADTLIENRVYGATLMEVGFPAGRCGFDIENHMELWDRLSLAGVFITGCGDSDSHYSDKGWLGGNNFASWIAAPAELPHPVPDEVFIASMKAGRLYAGDPTQLKAPLSFTAEDKPMGAIIPISEGDDRPREMVFSAEHLPEGWRVRLIDSGTCVKEHTIDWAGAYTFTFAVAPTRPVCFGRVEIYNADGRCVGLTNPIYLVRTEDGPALPAERLYEEVGE